MNAGSRRPVPVTSRTARPGNPPSGAGRVQRRHPQMGRGRSRGTAPPRTSLLPSFHSILRWRFPPVPSAGMLPITARPAAIGLSTDQYQALGVRETASVRQIRRQSCIGSPQQLSCRTQHVADALTARSATTRTRGLQRSGRDGRWCSSAKPRSAWPLRTSGEGVLCRTSSVSSATETRPSSRSHSTR
jgi:hypothetical protein